MELIQYKSWNTKTIRVPNSKYNSRHNFVIFDRSSMKAISRLRVSNIRIVRVLLEQKICTVLLLLDLQSSSGNGITTIIIVINT